MCCNAYYKKNNDPALQMEETFFQDRMMEYFRRQNSKEKTQSPPAF